MLRSTDEAGLKAEIQSLKENEIRESEHLDYKADFPSKSGPGRKTSPGLHNLNRHELLADVSAFANTVGGTLVIGVTEKKSEQGRSTGEPDELLGVEGAAPIDGTVNRIESLLRESLDPRVPGIRVFPVAGYPKGPIFVIQVPRSLTAPHAARAKGRYSYHARTTGGSHVMSTSELRTAFLQSAGQRAEIEQRRTAQIQQIRKGETPLRLPRIAGTLIVQVIPFASLTPTFSVDVTQLHGSLPSPPGAFSHSQVYCAEGLATYEGTRDQEDTSAYLVLSRDGSVTAVSVEFFESNGKNWVLHAQGVERFVVNAVRSAVDTYRQLEVSLPVFVVTSLLDVIGGLIPDGGRRKLREIRRTELLLPPVVVTNDQEIIGPLEPVFDAIWQAAGHRCSPGRH